MTTPDDLVERVARAIFDARHKDLRDCWSWDDYWGDDQEPDREFYYRDATAAIAIALEEAARVADANALEAWDFGADETRGLMRLQAADIAAAIRAMIKEGE